MAEDGAQPLWCAAAWIAEVDLVVTAAGPVPGSGDGLVKAGDGGTFPGVGADVQ